MTLSNHDIESRCPAAFGRALQRAIDQRSYPGGTAVDTGTPRSRRLRHPNRKSLTFVLNLRPLRLPFPAHFRAAGRVAPTVRTLKKVPTACITASVTLPRQASEVMDLRSCLLVT